METGMSGNLNRKASVKKKNTGTRSEWVCIFSLLKMWVWNVVLQMHFFFMFYVKEEHHYMLLIFHYNIASLLTRVATILLEFCFLSSQKEPIFDGYSTHSCTHASLLRICKCVFLLSLQLPKQTQEWSIWYSESGIGQSVNYLLAFITADSKISILTFAFYDIENCRTVIHAFITHQPVML